jgi:hypothetical protein
VLFRSLSESSPSCSGDIDHLRFSLIKIKNSLSNMAIGEAKKTLNDLKTMTWESEKQNIIIKISRCILLFQYDDAIKLIDDIITPAHRN